MPQSALAGRSPASETTPSAPAVFVCGLDGVIRLWSVGAQRLYGVPAGDAVGQKIAHVAGSDIATSDLRGLVALGRGGMWSRRHVAVRPGVRPTVHSTFTVADGPGGDAEIVVYSVEVAPSGLNDPLPQEAPFVPSFNDELTILCENNMAVTYVGPTYSSMFGLLARNLIGRDLRALLHPDDHSLWVRAWISALSQPNSVVPVNVRGRRDASGWRWLRQGILSRSVDRRIRGVAVTTSALAETSSPAGEASSIAEQTLLAVLEASIEGVWLTDAGGRGVFANARAGEIFGLSVDELLRRSLGEVVGEAAAHVGGGAGRRGEYELPYQRPDGGLSWIRLAITPRFDDTGRPLGTIITCAPLAPRVSGRPMEMEQLLGATEWSSQRHGQPFGLAHGQPQIQPQSQPQIHERSSEQSQPQSGPYGTGPSRDERVGPGAIASPLFDEARSRALLMKAVPSLSRRESEVVIRLILGDRVPTIARILFISQSTVRNHLASAFRKSGVSTQQELILLVNSAASA